MVRVTFPVVMQRHLAAPPVVVSGSTVREVLEAAFAQQPLLRSYLLDDAGAMRPHITMFVDGHYVLDRAHLGDAVRPDSQLHVLQALSGG